MKSKAPKNIRCYDNGGITFDRYTVLYMEFLESLPDTFRAVAYSAAGYNDCAETPGRHLGRRIAFSNLPPDCQKLVMQDLKPI